MHVQFSYSFSPLVVGHCPYLYSKYQLVVVTLSSFRYKNYHLWNSNTIVSAQRIVWNYQPALQKCKM